MVQKLLLLFLVLFGIGIVVFRLSGSGAEIARRQSFFTNPFTIIFENTIGGATSSASGIPFPFPDTPDIPFDEINASGQTYPAYDTTDARDELIAIETSYDNLNRRIADVQNFGNPSPYRGLVYIDESYSGVLADDVILEYITLASARDNSAPISISGWSLQNIRTKMRVYIPDGARVMTGNNVPTITPIQLNAGMRAIVATGNSPVGVSFLENMCTGYLGQFQTFVPSLDERCPTAVSEVQTEPATARTNDPYCASFANTVPQCRFYIGEPPRDVTPQCYSFVRNSLTFAGCSARHSWRPSYLSDTWRVFLNQRYPMWDNAHDSIRLLDSSGRTVDVWTY